MCPQLICIIGFRRLEARHGGGCDKYLLNFKTSLTSYQPPDDFRPMDSSAYENLDNILF